MNLLTVDEIRERVAKLSVDEILGQIAANAAVVEGRRVPTLASVSEDWVAKMIPLLVPYLGPPEAWVATLAGGATGPGAPIVSALVLLAEKAAVSAAASWAVKHNAANAAQ